MCCPTTVVLARVLSATVTWPDTLHQVKLPIVDMTVCRQPTWHGANITENMICAGYPEGGKDTCQVSVCGQMSIWTKMNMHCLSHTSERRG